MEKDSRERYMMTPEPWSKWEIRNLSKTKFLCQHSRWLFTQGRRHHCCHAGCIAGLGAGGNGQEGQELLCTFVTTGIVNITIQWRNSTFKRGFQSSNRSRQSRKPVKKKTCPHVRLILHSWSFPYCALLLMKGCSVKKSSRCFCQFHHHSIDLRSAAGGYHQQPLPSSPMLKCAHWNCHFLALSPNTEENKKSQRKPVSKKTQSSWQ